VKFEAVGVAEGDLGQRCTSTRIVDDVFYNAANVAMFLRIVESSEFCRRLVQASVGR